MLGNAHLAAHFRRRPPGFHLPDRGDLLLLGELCCFHLALLRAGFSGGRRALRKECGVTQVQLARALGVSTDELLGVRSLPLPAAEPRQARLWKRFQRMASLPERDQRAVLRWIGSLSQRRSA